MKEMFVVVRKCVCVGVEWKTFYCRPFFLGFLFEIYFYFLFVWEVLWF